MAATPEWLALDPGEEIVWTGKPRIRRILSTVASAVFWSVVALGVAVVLNTSLVGVLPADLQQIVFTLQAEGMGIAIWGVALLIVAAQVITVAGAYSRTVNVDYVLTDRNVYKKTGVLSETVTRVGLDKIQNTELQKDFLGNTFDYGTILLSTAGGGGVEMAITDLDDPQELRNEILTLAAAASGDDREAFGGSNLFATADPDDVAAAVAEVRSMREIAERIEREFT